MDLEQGLTVELSAVLGLANKVFPLTAMQGTQVPDLVYTLGHNERTQSLTGHDGLVQAQYQLDLYHSTYANLKALKKLLIQNLKTYNLRNIGSNGPFIQQVEIITDFEAYESEVKLYKGIIEFEVHFNE
jgi:hypothetical protein